MTFIFTPPRGLDRGRPREVRLSVAGRALAVVIGLLLAAGPTVGGFMLLEATSQRTERQRLAAEGVETAATVTRLWRPSKESKQWSVAYQFDVAGRTYTGKSRIPRAWSETLHVGGAVPVRFVGEAPARNVPAGLTRGVMPLGLPFLVGASLVVLGVVALHGLRRERALLADGRVSGAVVTKHTKQRTQHGGTYFTLRYEFQELSGAKVTGKYATSKKPPAIGSVISVLYDPDQPTRNKPYPLSLVTLAET